MLLNHKQVWIVRAYYDKGIENVVTLATKWHELQT
jgi:hypothetical protein